MANMNFGVNILPREDNTYTLGNSDKKWNIYANTINGQEMEIATVSEVEEYLGYGDLIDGQEMEIANMDEVVAYFGLA